MIDSDLLRTTLLGGRGEFFKNLVQSGLLRERQIADLICEMATALPIETVSPLVAKAIGEHEFTAWQVSELLGGRTAFRIGAYELREQLGVGGMGTVYLARHLSTGMEAAIKTIHKDLSSRSAARRRFQREIDLMRQFNHPNIVRAIESNTEAASPYVVMEFVPGVPLQHFVTGSRQLPTALSCECVRQAALGLQYAHDRGVIHRDVKPSNLMVCWPNDRLSPIVKVVDFGLTRLLDSVREIGITATGQCIGTPEYIAPEQACNSKRVDGRADVFSLGVTCYHLLAGKLPYNGDSKLQLIVARISERPVHILEAAPSLDHALAGIVMKCLARDPAERFQTPRELCDSLLPFTAGVTGMQTVFHELMGYNTPIVFSNEGDVATIELNDPIASDPISNDERIRRRLLSLLPANRRNSKRVLAEGGNQ